MGKIESIKDDHVRDYLRSIVDLIGVDVLGFTKEDIGLHLIRSGGDMAMFLSKIQTIIMMRIGRWSSDALLEYIREQVENFTHNACSHLNIIFCWADMIAKKRVTRQQTYLL